MLSAPTSSFGDYDGTDGADGDALVAVATAATARAVDDPCQGVLVVVIHPETANHRVIAGGGTSVLRAAVSVAVAAGNDRLWRDAPTDRTVESPTRALPEVISAAADAGGVRAVHTGCVRFGDVVEVVAIWFETWSGVARADDREAVLAMLADAAAADAVAAAERAEAEPPPPHDDVDDPAIRRFDPDDPRLEPVTGLLNPAAFDECVAGFEGEQATILLIDIDKLDDIDAEWGSDRTDEVMREVADRLVAACRRNDVVAYLARERFAILLGDVDRSSVLELGRRLLARIADPLPDGYGPASVTATIALAHQVGLVDLEEMLESAQAAVASGKRTGVGRLVLAA